MVCTPRRISARKGHREAVGLSRTLSQQEPATEAGLCVFTMHDIMQLQSVSSLCLLTAAFQWGSNKGSRWPAMLHREIKKDKVPAFGMFAGQQFVLARCVMRFPINHHPEE